MRISQIPLSKARHHYPGLARIQSVHSRSAYFQFLDSYAAILCSTLYMAQIRGRIVGSICAMPAALMRSVDQDQELQQACIGAGFAPHNLLVWANIHVDPAFRGQGIARDLSAFALQDAKERGRSGVLLFRYETDEIAAWSRARKDGVSTGLYDPRGYPTLILPV